MFGRMLGFLSADMAIVNAGEKMHRRAGVKMHYGRMGGRPRMRGTGSSSVTAKSALQFDQ
jgi:hypothetical protein